MGKEKTGANLLALACSNGNPSGTRGHLQEIESRFESMLEQFGKAGHHKRFQWVPIA
jgi:hypothetical protein